MRLMIVEDYPENIGKYSVIDVLPDPPEVVIVFDDLELAQQYVDKFYGSTDI